MIQLKKQFSITLFILILFFCLASATPISLKSTSWPVPKNLPVYSVTRIIDGDTIEVERLGKIRYIGINTPEIHHPTKGIEPYGFEAMTANRNLVDGKKVKLEYDIQQRDKYGRILAYVYVGSIFVNAYLVEAGYAQLMTYPPNVKYVELFKKLQNEARLNKRGLWGKIDLSKKTGQYLGSLKGKKYHLPTCKWAKKIKKENQIWFSSKKEAEKARYQPCGYCKP